MNVHATIIKIAFFTTHVLRRFYTSGIVPFFKVSLSDRLCPPLYPWVRIPNGRLCSDRKTKFLRNEEIHCKCSTYIIDHKILVWLPKSIMTRKNLGITYGGPPTKKRLFSGLDWMRVGKAREGREGCFDLFKKLRRRVF